MKRSIISSIILGVVVVSGLVYFQISTICYPKKVEIEFDLKEYDAGIIEYGNCLQLEKKIDLFNQKCDPNFAQVTC